MSEVLHGNDSGDQLNVNSDKTQVYGLKGNDTLISDGKSDVLLIGGSGEDSLVMKGGKGSLSGGAGADTFEFHYSATETISAVIEDFDPSSDKIVVNFDGDTAPQLTSVKSGNDVVWRSSDGKFNLTLKSVRDNDYFDGEAPEQVWDVLKLTNDEREKLNLPALTLSEGLMTGASIRAEEITEKGKLGLLTDHKRPNGESYKTVLVDEDLSLEQKYHNYAENLQAGAESSEDVMKAWMNSPKHEKNILDREKNGYRKLGVGYNYDADSDRDHQYHYWTQLFADSIKSPETVSTDELLTAQIDTSAASKRVTLRKEDDTYTNTALGATINAREGNDSITNTGANVSISGGKGNDTIDNSGSFVTIKAGTGNDYIRLSNDSKENLIQYKTGDGNDTISGFHATDTLSISADEYNPVTIGNDIIVSVGTDSITLADAATLSPIIDGTRSKLYILTENADTLNNTVDGATIMALGGNDSIRNDGANVLFVYESGQDTIRGFNETSTLKISEGIACSSLDSGKDIILNLDTGSVKIFGAASLGALNILDTNDNPVNVSDARNIVGAETADNINNSIDGATIQAFGGDDTITNSGNKVSIVGGEGSDSISNSGNRVSIVGGEGSDYISSSGSNVSIDAGAGNDIISLEGNKRNLINYNSGDGNDVIEGFNEKSTLQIDEGEGNYSSIKSGDDIIVTVDDSSITLTGAATLETINIDGEEIIPEEEPRIPYDAVKYNGNSYKLFNESMTWEEAKAYCEARGGHLAVITDAGEQAAIQSLLEEKGTKNSYWLGGYLPADTSNGGSGEIAVSLQQNVSYIEYSLGDSVSIGGGDDDSKFITLTEGDDAHSNSIEGATIQALGGNDYITNESLGANTSISGGVGNDTISNYGSQVTIIGGDGNDSILNYGDSVKIDGGAGNDSVTIYGSEVTIDSGDGDDYVSNSSSGKNVLISGYGDDTIANSGDWATINGGDGNDSINNWTGDSVKIDGGAGNDSIDNTGSQVSINGGDGNDSIDNIAIHVSIEGGEGDDYIYNSLGDSVTIDGGAGNDSVINSIGDSLTIAGGKDDDLISLTSSANNNLIKYASGDGNDTIYGFNSTSTLSISGDSYSSVTSGDDIVITVGDGSILIKDAASLGTIQIDGEEDTTPTDTVGVTINNTLSNTLITGTSYADSISNSGNNVTIQALGGNDSILNDSFGSNTSISGGDGDDTINSLADSDTLNGGEGKDSILNNGGNNVLIFGDNGDDIIDNWKTFNFSATIDAGAGNDEIHNDFSSNDSLNGGAGKDSIWIYGENVTARGGLDNDYICVYTEYIGDSDTIPFRNNLIDGGAGDDSIENNGSDVTINGGAGDDSISLTSSATDNLIAYAKGDGKDTIYGFDGNDTLSISGGSYSSVKSGDDVVITVGDGSILLKDAASLGTIYINGTLTGDTLDSKFITLTEGNDTHSNSIEGATIQALGGNDSIYNSSSYASVSIDGGAGNDYAVNGSAYVDESGNLVEDDGGSNVTMSGGTGSDEFWNFGNNAIINGNENADNLYNGNLNKKGGTNVIVNGDNGDDYLWNRGDSVTINAGAGNDNIVNREGNKVVINGGAGNDSITNSNGGFGDWSGDSLTIDAGADNDLISLTSSATNNLIKYASGDGNDTIYGFNSSSTLSISGDSYSSVKSGDDVVITVGDGSILLKDVTNLSTANIIGTLSDDSDSADGWKWVTGEAWDYTHWGAGQPDGDGSALMIYFSEENGWALGDWNDISADGTQDTQPFFGTENIGFICEWEEAYDDKFITLTEDADPYSNTVEGATIAALGGNDSLYNDTANVSINGGAGNDSIHNWGGNNVTINAGSGSDTVNSGTDNSIILGGAGKDSILNHGAYVLVEAGGGNDTIACYIKDDDTAGTSSSYTTLRGGRGHDHVDNYGHHALIEGGTGNDTLLNHTGDDGGIHKDYEADYSTILGGDGDDWIDNQGDSVSIDGGDGDDDISNDAGSQVTIEGGAGDDSIWNCGGNNSTISGGDGDDTITNSGNKVSIIGGDGDDDINNDAGSQVTILGGAKNDSIINTGLQVKIYGGIDNDTIGNSGDKATIYGGTGDDYIENSGKNVTIFGGKGNDQISLTSDSKNNFIRYTNGDGNDTIWGSTQNDTINILADGWSSLRSGTDDLIIEVKSGGVVTGSILLVDARKRPPHITLGESGTEGGTRGGDGNDSSSGRGGRGGNGDGRTSGGKSSNDGNDSDASGGESASGTSGRGTSSRGGNRDSNVDINYARRSLEGINIDGSFIPEEQQTSGGRYIYTGGNQTVSDYQSGEQILFCTEYNGAFYDNAGNFNALSPTGKLTVQNAKDKIIDIDDYAGKPFVKAYAASNPGVLDGRGIAGFEIINGSSDSDTIYAGDGGSQLWGGTGNVTDVLFGGNGSDVFVSGKTQGSDSLLNVSSADTVHFDDAKLSDIISAEENDGVIAVRFNTGNTVTVQSSEALSGKFLLADGSAYRYDHSNKSWQTLPRTYTGGNQIVSNYQSGEQILFNPKYNGAFYDNAGNFNALSPTGSLVIQNAKDKIIDLRDSAGNPFVKAYAASNPGVIDGRGIAGFEVIKGSSGSDTIYAGDGGSQLWGGANSAADVLFGGNGSDVFVSGKTQGSDSLLNVSSADTVHFDDAKLSDIISAEENDGFIAVKFNMGNTVTVQSSEALSGKFLLADGSAYRYDHSNKSWQTA